MLTVQENALGSDVTSLSALNFSLFFWTSHAIHAQKSCMRVNCFWGAHVYNSLSFSLNGNTHFSHNTHTHIHTHTNTKCNTYTHTTSLFLSLSHTHVQMLPLSLSLSLSLTHTHTHTQTQNNQARKIDCYCFSVFSHPCFTYTSNAISKQIQTPNILYIHISFVSIPPLRKK